MSGLPIVIRMNEGDREVLLGAIRSAVVPNAFDSNGVARTDYINGHAICSSTKLMKIIGRAFADVISITAPRHILAVELAGGTPAIAAMMLADREDVEFSFIRKTRKEHGFPGLFSAAVQVGSTALVVDDVISTGRTGCAVIESARRCGIDVVGYVAITNRPTGGVELINRLGVDTYVAIPNLGLTSAI